VNPYAKDTFMQDPCAIICQQQAEEQTIN